MSDLNIPKLNMNSDKYIFKKKLGLKRKSKRKLLIESALMFLFSLFFICINYLIPNKILMLQNLPLNLNKSFTLFIDLFLSIYEIFLLNFIFVTSFIALMLMLGSFYRLIRALKRKSKNIIYK